MRKTALFSFALLTTFFLACEPEENLPNDTSTIPMAADLQGAVDDEIKGWLADNPAIPGVIVGIRSHQNGRYITAKGYDNEADNKRMSPQGIFGIGSIHKNFKWVVLLRLAEEGRIDLDAKVNTIIDRPQLPGVTVRHLMQHSCLMPDIPDIEALNDKINSIPFHHWTYDEVMDYLEIASGATAGWNYVDGKFTTATFNPDVTFIPGVHTSYSSFGPLVAMRIAEEVTGKDYRALEEELIISALGLTNTTWVGVDDNPANLVQGYYAPGSPQDYFDEDGKSLGRSSANGYSHWMDMADLLEYCHRQVSDDEFLDPRTQEEMFNQAIIGPYSNRSYGSGIYRNLDRDYWGHSGDGIFSHATTWAHDAEPGTTYVVFTNLRDPDGFFTPHF